MYPTSKLDIVSKVRAVVRQTDYIDKTEDEQYEIATKFVKAYKKTHDVTPELVAFLFQKFNAYHLLTVSLANKTSDYIPFLKYIDVEKAAKECGHDNLYATIASNLSKRKTDPKYSAYRIGEEGFPETANSKGQDKAASRINMATLLKSASKSEDLLKEARRDYRFVKHAMTTTDSLNSAYNHLSEMYYHVRGLKSAINHSPVKFNKTAQKVIAIMDFNKKANLIGGEYSVDAPILGALVEFRNTLDKYAKLDEEMEVITKALPDMVKDMKRVDKKRLLVGDKIKVIKSVRSGFGVVPGGETVTVLDIDVDNNLLKVEKTKGKDVIEMYLPMDRLHDSGYTRVS